MTFQMSKFDRFLKAKNIKPKAQQVTSQSESSQKIIFQKNVQQTTVNLEQSFKKSQKINCGQNSIGNIVSKIQEKIIQKKYFTFQCRQKNHNKISHQKQQSKSLLQQNPQNISSNPLQKRKNPNVRSTSFADYSLSQKQIQLLKNIQVKYNAYDKIFKTEATKQLKKQSCLQKSAVKQKYRTKFFHSGSPIAQNSGQLSFIKKYIYGTGKTPSKFMISSWNMNGIKKSIKKRFVFGYLKLSNPDIFCVQEIRIDYESFKKEPVIFQGYNGYWNFCKCSKGYSGVAVFSKYPPKRIIQDFPGNEQFSQQGRVLTLQFEKFYLVNVYAPAAGQRMQRLHYKVKEYQPVFFQFVNELSQDKDVIIVGDLNVARCQLDAYIYNGVEDRQAYHPLQRRSFEKELKEGGWIDTFRHFHPVERKFSWWNIQLTGRNKNMGKRIDYYLVKESFIKYLQDSDVMNHIWGSDHCPIELKVNFDIKKNEQNNQKDQMIEKSTQKESIELRQNVQQNKTKQQCT